jgi:hypothetical protein
MKIYFGGSIKGGRQDAAIYAEIIKLVKTYGEVITEYVGNASLTEKGEVGIDPVQIFKRDMGWLEEADVLVADVTQPSLGVGYELAKAEAMKKPMLCIFRPSSGRQLSSIISGNSNIKVVSCELSDLPEILRVFFANLKHE